MKKTNLDEMQEHTLLRIEHSGCWIAFWGLFAAIVIQFAIGWSLREAAGEVILFFFLCGYLCINSLRHGIWDRHLNPSLKVNLLISLAAGAFLGVFNYFRFHSSVPNPNRLFILCFLTFCLVFLLSFATLSITGSIQQKRRKKLDEE